MRRAIISTIFMAGALVLAASCNKIEDKPVAPERTVITALADQISTGTKVEMAYHYDALWQTGDQIQVKQGQTTDTFTLVDGEGTTTGTFEGTKSISGEIEAFYPVSVGETMEWPAVQTNTQAVPMYARQTISGTGNETVNFSSLGAILQIAISTKTEDVTITSITLQDDSKPLSGKFTVTDGQAKIAENAANPGVTLNLGESGVPVGVAATYFYIAIPAGAYNGDKFTLTFTDAVHGMRCVMTSTTFPDITRNTVGRITLAGEFTNLVTVKFDLNFEGKEGDKTASIADMKVERGHYIRATVPTPYARKYVFRGWYKESTCENPWDFHYAGVYDDMTLYAKWVEDPASPTIHGHEYVKLAGMYWSTENVEDDSEILPISDDNYIYYYEDGYCARDAANRWNVGSDSFNWHIPSQGEWETLFSKCDYTTLVEHSYKGKLVKGVLISGKEECFEEGNSIFLPAFGAYNFNEDEPGFVNEVLFYGDWCFYWTNQRYVYMMNVCEHKSVLFTGMRAYPYLRSAARAVAQ